MAGNTFGELFRVTTFGESHGALIGVVIDGCPSGISISCEEIQSDLDRRRPGQSNLTSPRKEQDLVQIASGIFDGKTTGAPIALIAANQDVKSEDYDALKNVYRPSHADFTYQQKYGTRDWRGGGRSSARETWSRVAAGAVAKKLLSLYQIECLACVQSIGKIRCSISPESLTRDSIESNPVRCPDPVAAEQMQHEIERVASEGDSLGGIIYGVIKNLPVGLGEPVFDKLHADLGKAMLSINAVKGFEVGAGFAACAMRGSEHNDPFMQQNGETHTASNHAGGVLGGISSGEPLYFRVAFKPVSTIHKPQKSVDIAGNSVEFRATGRHDACVLPRAVAIVEAMSALVIADHLLRQRSQKL